MTSDRKRGRGEVEYGPAGVEEASARVRSGVAELARLATHPDNDRVAVPAWRTLIDVGPYASEAVLGRLRTAKGARDKILLLAVCGTIGLRDTAEAVGLLARLRRDGEPAVAGMAEEVLAGLLARRLLAESGGEAPRPQVLCNPIPPAIRAAAQAPAERPGTDGSAVKSPRRGGRRRLASGVESRPAGDAAGRSPKIDEPGTPGAGSP